MRGLAALLALAPLWAQTPAQREARDILKQLIEINTTDSSGDNTRAAEAMAVRFREAGYPAADVQVLAPVPRKGNLVVRLRGSGAARPILFIGHLDVVEALRSDWSSDPFQLIEKDGWLYGRGTADMKGDVAVLVSTFLRLKREGVRPSRDLILALTADEEGGTHNGVAWLLENHRPLVDAEFAINPDAGGGHLKNGKHLFLAMQAAEKVYLSFKLEVTIPAAIVRGRRARTRSIVLPRVSPGSRNSISRCACSTSRAPASSAPLRSIRAGLAPTSPRSRGIRTTLRQPRGSPSCRSGTPRCAPPASRPRFRPDTPRMRSPKPPPRP